MTINLAICDLGISGNAATPFLLWGFECLTGSQITLPPASFAPFTNHLYSVCGKPADCCVAKEIIHLTQMESIPRAGHVRC